MFFGLGITSRFHQFNRIDEIIGIVGGSGTGKTSLINCGLGNQFVDSDWLPLFVRRSTDLNWSLDRRIAGAMKSDGQDPDSFVQLHGGSAFEQALKDGIALSDFLLEELSGQVDMQTVDGRARLAELAKPLVSRIPRGVYRELLTEQLAATVGLSASKLEAVLATDRQRPGARTGASTSIT